MDGSNGSHIEEEPGEQQRLKTASGKDKDYQVTGRQDSSYKSLVFHTSFDKAACSPGWPCMRFTIDSPCDMI